MILHIKEGSVVSNPNLVPRTTVKLAIHCFKINLKNHLSTILENFFIMRTLKYLHSIT